MLQINEEARNKILENAINEKDFCGMWMMSLLPKSHKKLKSFGIALKDEQALRSLHTIFDNRHFILFFLDGNNKETYITFYEVYPVDSKYGNMSFTKEIWRGYVQKHMNN